MSKILPDKFTPLEKTIIGEAANLLTLIDQRGASVGQIYVECREATALTSYDDFVAALTFLYAAGAIEYRNQIVRKV